MMAWMNQPEGGHDHGGAAATPLTDAQARKAMGMATDAEVTSLEDTTGKNADCLFLTLMIRHHEGAIPMADAAIRLTSTPRVIAVATSMKAGQSADEEHPAAARLRGLTTSPIRYERW
jgi:uncharacterized protein (DUF305 family)